MTAALLLIIGALGPPRTIVVAPASSIPTLGAALALARDGDSIIVTAGYYRESNLTIDRRVVVVGRGRPVIDGGGRPILTITADGVTVRGLILQNVAPSSTDDRAAIRIDRAGGCLLADNLIRDSFFAIYAARAHDCIIRDNRIVGRGAAERANANALHLFSSREMTLANNVVSGHRDGIYLEFSRGIRIQHNRSTDNGRYGLHFMYSDSCSYRDNVFRDNRAGVAVMYSGAVTIAGNTFARAAGSAAYGLLLKEIRDSRLAGNEFSDNTVALSLEATDRLIATDNVFDGNGWAVRVNADSDGSRFEGNRFSGNAFDVVTNSRQSRTLFRGNWWDRYDGFDLDQDGRGDVPFQPVRLFGLIVEQHPAAILLLHSVLVTLLETAERIAPVLSPVTPVDTAPLMRPPE